MRNLVVSTPNIPVNLEGSPSTRRAFGLLHSPGNGEAKARLDSPPAISVVASMKEAESKILGSLGSSIGV